jgi:hypothetical protein
MCGPFNCIFKFGSIHRRALPDGYGTPDGGPLLPDANSFVATTAAFVGVVNRPNRTLSNHHELGWSIRRRWERQVFTEALSRMKNPQKYAKRRPPSHGVRPTSPRGRATGGARLGPRRVGAVVAKNPRALMQLILGICSSYRMEGVGRTTAGGVWKMEQLKLTREGGGTWGALCESNPARKRARRSGRRSAKRTVMALCGTQPHENGVRMVA